MSVQVETEPSDATVSCDPLVVVKQCLSAGAQPAVSQPATVQPTTDQPAVAELQLQEIKASQQRRKARKAELARLSRQRKKVRVQQMEEEMEAARRANVSLKAQLAVLTAENARLLELLAAKQQADETLDETLDCLRNEDERSNSQSSDSCNNPSLKLHVRRAPEEDGSSVDYLFEEDSGSDAGRGQPMTGRKRGRDCGSATCALEKKRRVGERCSSRMVNEGQRLNAGLQQAADQSVASMPGSFLYWLLSRPAQSSLYNTVFVQQMNASDQQWVAVSQLRTRLLERQAESKAVAVEAQQALLAVTETAQGASPSTPSASSTTLTTFPAYPGAKPSAGGNGESLVGGENVAEAVRVSPGPGFELRSAVAMARVVVTRSVEDYKLAFDELCKIFTDEQVATYVKWVETHGSVCLQIM